VGERKTGTREWAEANLNIALGCEHGCRYCYARANALRFRRIDDPEDWPTMTVNQAAVDKGYGLRKGKTIMFPTAHDITPSILEECVTVLRKVLGAGNRVLIVTKPHLECVVRLCSELVEWHEQVLWRFTIGATDDEILALWEPHAPEFNERFLSLRHAFLAGWQTSVSVEPMLDPANVDDLVARLDPFVSETIWIGKMNHIRTRCRDVDPAVLDAMEAELTDEKILAMVDRLGSNPKVVWKDSVKLVIEAHEEDE